MATNNQYYLEQILESLREMRELLGFKTEPKHDRTVLICGATQDDDCLCVVAESLVHSQLFDPVIKDNGDEVFKEKIVDPIPLNNQVGEPLKQVKAQSDLTQILTEHERKVLICGYTEAEDCFCVATEVMKSEYDLDVMDVDFFANLKELPVASKMFDGNSEPNGYNPTLKPKPPDELNLGMKGEELTEQETALYDSQVRIWEVDAQRRLSKSHILVNGLKRTAIEFCKNIVLEGVGSVTLNDDQAMAIDDSRMDDILKEYLILDYILLPKSDTLNTDGFHTFRGEFWNSFSMGMDAKVLYAFHTERKSHPEKIKNLLVNQSTYAKIKCTQWWFYASHFHPSSQNSVQLEKVKVIRRSSQWEGLFVPPSIRSIGCLNLPSFSGGFNPWGTPSRKKLHSRDLTSPYVDDGLMEVVGFRDAWHGFVLLAPNGHGTHLALVGVFYPYNQGALFTAWVVMYALTSGFAGYTTISFCCQFEGTNWKWLLKLSGGVAVFKVWFRELPNVVLDSLSPEQVMHAESENSTDEVMTLLQQGNQTRTTEPTCANDTSSCSHAILQVRIFYEEALAALSIAPLNQHFDKTWLSHVQLKATFFYAEACYWYGLKSHEKEEIAEEIARLKSGISPDEYVLKKIRFAKQMEKFKDTSRQEMNQKYSESLDVFRKVLLSEGVKGLYKDFGPALAPSVSANAACFLAYEVTKVRIQFVDEKGNSLSVSGTEFEKGMALQGLNLLDKEQNIYITMTYKVHDEATMDESIIVELKFLIESGAELIALFKVLRFVFDPGENTAGYYKNFLHTWALLFTIKWRKDVEAVEEVEMARDLLDALDVTNITSRRKYDIHLHIIEEKNFLQYYLGLPAERSFLRKLGLVTPEVFTLLPLRTRSFLEGGIVKMQLGCLGEEHVGYRRLDFPTLKLSIVGGRPFSCGGQKLFRHKLLSARFGVHNMEESVKRIYKAALGTPEDHSIIFLAHNGHVGLGSNINDICGRDWVYLGGDHGDPDLEHAISQLKETTKLSVPLVMFGHMHKQLGAITSEVSTFQSLRSRTFLRGENCKELSD